MFEIQLSNDWMSRSKPNTSRRQGIFWMLTVAHAAFTPFLPSGCAWIKGQLERGDSGFLHWQIVVAFSKKKSLAGVVGVFGKHHAELTFSDAAAEYVWKDATHVAGTRFELGVKPIQLSSSVDWENVWTAAKSGDLAAIPPFVRVKSYRTIRAIGSDFSKAHPMVRTCKVFWGPTGTGKSHRAWAEAGPDAYSKSARSKFWDGYQSEEAVILDEFRGAIDVGYLLTWLDRYPVRVEVKGSSLPLNCKKFWICSNLPPERWYPDLDPWTLEALLRRLEVEEMPVLNIL